jgi:heme exporter protein B
MDYIGKVLAIAAKDLISETRAKKLMPAMLVFSLTVIIIFNFLFEPGTQNLDALAPGILWVAFSFAGMLGLSRSFAVEQEQGALRGLMLAPMDRSAIFLGKLLSNLVFLFGVELISLLAFGIFFNVNIFQFLPGLGAVLGLATFGFVTVGSLYSAMASNIRLREILLPVLLFPIIIPLLIAAVQLTTEVLKGQPLEAARGWMNLLIGYDGIFFVVGLLTFEHVIGE